MPPSDPKRSDRPKAGLLETLASSPLSAPDNKPKPGTLGATIAGGPIPAASGKPKPGTIGSTMLGGPVPTRPGAEARPKAKLDGLGSTIAGGPAPAASPSPASAETKPGRKAPLDGLGATIAGGPAPAASPSPTSAETKPGRRAQLDGLGSTLAGGPAPTVDTRPRSERETARDPDATRDSSPKRDAGTLETMVSTRRDGPAKKRAPSDAHAATMIGGPGGGLGASASGDPNRGAPPDRTLGPSGTIVRGDDMRASAMDQTILSASHPAPESTMRSELDRAIFTTPGQPGKIHRFIVLRVLGEGGMGVVYAAFDEELDRKVAIKLVRDDLHEGTHGRSRMLREAQAMAKLSHPNVVQVYEVGQFAGQIFVAMEFVEGMPLSDWLEAEERSWQEIRDMFVQAGRGLAAAHDKGLVHRDFKPDNVLVGKDGRARVLDFGLARAEGPGRGTPTADSMLMRLTSTNNAFEAKLTVAGSIMGTPAYMSPEQHEGAPTGAPSDQFSLCVALYEAVYGQHPFAGETYQELADSVTGGKLRPPPSGSGVPEWLYQALATGMAVDPDQRHPSMDTLLAELSQDSTPPIARSRWLWPGVTIFAVVVAVLVTLGLVNGPAPTEEELALIAKLEGEARDAAERSRWVYPGEGDPEDTAYRRIAALEALEGGAAAEGSERAKELRLAFADELVNLGNKYYDEPSTRPFARDAYVQALVFDPDNAKAGERAGMTLGQLADLRERAVGSEFSDAEVFTAEALTVLAQDDPDARAEGLVALQDRKGFGAASTQMMMMPVVESLGGQEAKRKLRRRLEQDLLAAADLPLEPAPAERGAGAGDPAADTDGGDTDGDAEPEPEPEPTKSKGRSNGGGGKGKTKGKDRAETGASGGDEGDESEPVYDPVKSMELTREAEAARRRGALGEAEQLFHQALGFWNRNAAALMGLSDINFDRGAFDRAVKFAKQAVRAEPKNGDYRLRLGDAYFKVLRYNDARQAYEKASELGNGKAKERLKRLREKTGG